MRLEPSDPDIETVVTRIERGDIDLQPEFQRGEVWSKAKKQRLVDSILRDWHVPPIHVIELRGSRKQEVLDGQQRLAAIRDFVRGDVTVDGTIEPLDPKIEALHGKKYRELPDEWKRQFNQFTLRIFRIVDYTADEPGELFFRLNQPTSLTAAEQRNAFFGPVRSQVKKLVDMLGDCGLDKDVLGFSNSRMAYDDIVARVAVTVERKKITEKLTANDLVQTYRSERPLSDDALGRVAVAIRLIGATRSSLVGKIQFNKATIYSWFIFVIRAVNVAGRLEPALLGTFIPQFEERRSVSLLRDLGEPPKLEAEWFSAHLLNLYTDRSASRVADVSSVVLRDAAIWFEFEVFLKHQPHYQFPIERVGVGRIHDALRKGNASHDEEELARNLLKLGWGTQL